MLQLRKSTERGLGDHGWLKSRHTFSFADYYDPSFMGFRSLRVINEDRIAGGTGFGAHPHRDMEIISYVVKGGLEHKDSMGNKTVILPGEVQRMSAGTGVTHSEFNHLADQETHFFQIWVLPDQRGHEPGYGQKDFSRELDTKDLVLVVSREGRDGSITIHQDADIYISRLKAEKEISFAARPERYFWVQAIKGNLEVNGLSIKEGDGLAIENETELRISSQDGAEMMLFDLN